MASSLDSIVSLAFTLHSSPGVQAVLLGSGASRAAGIPTGWEVVLDLIRRVAAAQGKDAGDEPDQWYRETFGAQAGYSSLLDQLCRTPAERQQLLKGYFEPTAREREDGLKLPTAAHEAVAELMAKGLVRVVITTNFDRLLEQALEKRGIVPTVIASADQATGMIPLTHQSCCIIKIHGDYLDTRILNTEEELAAYAGPMQALIERVFDEFGLIVCGWSATWDPALRHCIERTANRRFSSYWTSLGTPTSEAAALIAQRAGIEVPIKSADDFFERLLDNVRGLEEFDRPHPLSLQAAIAATKRYLSNSDQRIRLHDLYRDVLGEALAHWRSSRFPGSGEQPTVDAAATRVRAYDQSSETIVALTALIAGWSTGEHDDLLIDALRDAGDETVLDGSGFNWWSDLRPYPATRMLYAAGMGAILANRPNLLSRLLTTETPTWSDKKTLALDNLLAPRLGDSQRFYGLFNGERRFLPMSDWLHHTLRDAFRDRLSDTLFTLLFDTFEFYQGVAFAASAHHAMGWVPVGAWAYRNDSLTKILKGLEGQAVRFGGKPFAESCPVMGADPTALAAKVQYVLDFRAKLSIY